MSFRLPPRLRFFGGLSPEETKVFKIQLLLLVIISTLLYLPFPGSAAWRQLTGMRQTASMIRGWDELSWFLWLAAAPLILRLIRRHPMERFHLRESLRRILLGSLIIYFLVVHVRYGVHLLIDLNTTQGGLNLALDNYVYDTIGLLPLDLLTFGGFFTVSFVVDFYFKLQAQAEAARELRLRAFQLESDLARSELATLRSQLHPHFLFNSFNAIATLVRLGRNDQAVEIIALLSALLRLAIDRSGLHEVPLQMELDFVRCYLGLEQVRFADKLRLEFVVEPAALEVMVPNTILQPLVENAIKHGIAIRTQPGTIRLAVNRAGEHLQVEITNDGPEAPCDVRPGKPGVGLANTRAQLKRLYGTNATLSLIPLPTGGTTVTLRLPLRLSAPSP